MTLRKRRSYRHRKRLEATFTAGAETYRGVTSDLSEHGLFIRTRYAFVPGTEVEVEIFMPDGGTAKVRGNVTRSIRTMIAAIKNGMGIDLTVTDDNYLKLVKEITEARN